MDFPDVSIFETLIGISESRIEKAIQDYENTNLTKPDAIFFSQPEHPVININIPHINVFICPKIKKGSFYLATLFKEIND